jgi:hypothetical protein
LFASDGKKRVPYSLRHTYATMRISEGVSVFQLAANMGTSVEILEDFHGKKRMRDPKTPRPQDGYRGNEGLEARTHLFPDLKTAWEPEMKCRTAMARDICS